MNGSRTLTLNDRGILLVCTVVMTLVFALGFMTASYIKKEDVTIFTRDDLERIVELQEMEDERKSGVEVYAYKDENGNLMIGWDYSNTKK